MQRSLPPAPGITASSAGVPKTCTAAPDAETVPLQQAAQRLGRPKFLKARFRIFVDEGPHLTGLAGTRHDGVRNARYRGLRRAVRGE